METMEQLPVFTKDPAEEKPSKRVYKKRIEKTDEKDVKFMPDEFEEFGSNWIPENEGDTIEGFVQPSEDYIGEFGPVPRVLVGERRVFCGAGLRDLPKLEGRYVRITYEGKQKSQKKGHQDFRKFTIRVRKE